LVRHRAGKKEGAVCKGRVKCCKEEAGGEGGRIRRRSVRCFTHGKQSKLGDNSPNKICAGRVEGKQKLGV
jgi:hypothetical protein